LLTPFAGLLNLGRRLGVPDSVLAPALRGAGVPDVVDVSEKIEQLVRSQVQPETDKPKRRRRRLRG